MPELPRQVEPSDAERLATYLGRMTPGGAGGQSRVVGPVMSRDAMRAQVLGGGDEDSLDSRESQIDQFAVTGTATSTFTLTFSPLDKSWNVSLNGVTLKDGTDYSIAGTALTILAPATLFAAAATQGSPWDLQVQYDYLAAVPTTPAQGGTLASSTTANSQPISAALPTASVVGDLLVAWFVGGWDVATPPAGWTLLDNVTASSGSNTTYVRVYWKIATASDITNGLTATASGGYWWTVAIVTCQGYSSVGAHSLASATGSSTATPSAVAAAGALILRGGLMRSSSGGASLAVSPGTEIIASAAGITPLEVTSQTSGGSASAGTVTATGADVTAGIVGSIVVVNP